MDWRIEFTRNADKAMRKLDKGVAARVFDELERLIVADGWIRCDVKGSHYQYRHPLKKGKVTIPRHGGDIPLRVAISVLRQAGLK